jgi:hypothetical protein
MDVRDGVETLLDPSACRLEGRFLRRLGGTFGEWTTVVCTPTDDAAVRRTVLVLAAVRCAPGSGIGPFSG